MPKFDVVGVGCCAVDYLGIVPHYPKLDVKMELMEFSKQGGGPVGTALVTLARLGAHVSYIGKVGDDEFGRFLIDAFRKEGVDTKNTIIEKGASCPFAFIIVDKKTGKRTIVWSRAHISNLHPGEMNRKAVTAGKILHVDQYDIDAAISAAKWAKEAGIMVVFDAESMGRGVKTLLKLTDVLITSEDFASDFTGKADIEKAARDLYKSQGGIVVVTGGDKGCVCISGDGMVKKPAFRVQVKDTTGAGDVFHGAFIYGLLQDWELDKTAEFSCAVAALKCRELGGRAGIPRLNEVQRFLKRS